MQTTLIDPTNLFRIVHFFDILAAVVFAVSGALVAYVGLNGLSISNPVAMITSFLVTFSVRGPAIRYGWSLPVFRGSTKAERWKTAPKDSPGG